MKAYQKLFALVGDYVDCYTFEGETEEGSDVSYVPTKQERGMISDAITGVLSDEDILTAIERWLKARKPKRRRAKGAGR